jgi:hypothetical protein
MNPLHASIEELPLHVQCYCLNAAAVAPNLDNAAEKFILANVP